MSTRIVRDSDDSADDFSDCAPSVDPLREGSPDPLTSSVNTAVIQRPEPKTVYPTPSVSNDQNNHSPSNHNLKRARTIHGLEDVHSADNKDSKLLKRRKTATPAKASSWRHSEGSIQNEGQRDVFDFDDAPPHPSKSDHLPGGISDEVENELGREEYLHTENDNTLDKPALEDINSWAPDLVARPEPAPLYEAYEPIDIPNRTPFRSKSTQIPIDSPHDTEPMSSRSLARTRRVLTMGSQLPQSSTSSADELALPVSIEVAVPLPPPDAINYSVGPEPQESAANSYDSDDFGGMPKEMYVPRSTRSRQRSKAEPSNGVVNDLKEVIEIQDEEERAQSPVRSIDETGPDPTSCGTAIQQNEQPIQETPHNDDAQQESYNPGPVENTDSFDIPQKTKRPRKNTKKKLKRGKTASVLVRKTVESDVEDDVIWIDERPLAPAPETVEMNTNHKTSAYQDDEETLGETLKAESNIPQNIEPKENTPQVEPSAPAPKKRGRKRKKTKDTTEPTAQSRASPPVQIQTPEPADPNSPLKDVDENTLPQHQPQLNNEPDVIHTNRGYDIDKLDKSGEDKREGYPHDPQPCPQSPTRRNTTEQGEVETPKKDTTASDSTGPTKHSPISVTNRVAFRVGLSRKARIAPLLKIVRK